MDPEGKVALVTGGAGGLGTAFTKILLKHGANVVMCDVNEDVGKQKEKEFNEEFGAGRALFIRVDVRDESQIEGAMQTAKRQFKRLDIVINNAGVLNEHDWELCIDINLNGVIRGTLLALKHLGKDEGGQGGIIVNIASIAGLVVFGISPIYDATKRGPIGFSAAYGKPLHYERTGVRVVTLCPGATDTNMARNFRGGIRHVGPEVVEQLLESFSFQPADAVGESLLHIIQEAESGTVWVSENNETFRVELSDHHSMRVKT